MMSCELLSSHGPAYPKIVYHNAQWTSHPGSEAFQNFPTFNRDQSFTSDQSFSSDQNFQCRSQERWANSTFPTNGNWGRRHTVDHLNVSPLETNRKRQKVSRPSNSFRRKSLLFFKMLGSGEWRERDRSDKYQVKKCVRELEEEEPTSPIEEPIHADRFRSELYEGTPYRRNDEEEEVNRTVSDSLDEVVLRRGSRATRRQRRSISKSRDFIPGPQPAASDFDITPSFTDELPPRPSKPPRPSSCYVNNNRVTPLEVATGSGFQRKLRRLSASVKNFSLERMIHHRKQSGPLLEEEMPEVTLPPSYIEPRRISDPAIANRKSLPADFRYENVINYFPSHQQVTLSQSTQLCCY